MEAGTIASWHIKEGDSFGAGDVVCSIETDKATVDFEAQDNGILAKILAHAGSGEINCGVPIMVTVEDAADVPAFADFVLEAGAAPAAAAPTPTPAPTTSPPPPPPVTPPAPSTPMAPTPPIPVSGQKAIASPLAHKLAKELGHNIAQIAGTGPGGRIIAADVKEFVPMAAAAPAVAIATPAPAQAAIAAAAVAVTPPPVAGAGYTDYPLSDSAREVAARLTQSKRNVPHYYLTVDLSMDELIKMRSTLNASINDAANQIGVYELLLKATAAAMKAVPSANAAWMDSVVRVYDSVDINVVVGNGDSLYTPVIADVGGRGVKALSSDLKAAEAVLEGVNEGELTPNFLTMGTITVMNLGMYGIKSCAPIIREPQSCALAFGVIENRIVPSGDESLYKESVMMTATMSFDHRVVDGAVGAQWLAAFKSHVENPTTLLL
jgi:pyruvate dehydrogenase E2 component (dihydrolipoamide acetyltransferase)